MMFERRMCSRLDSGIGVDVHEPEQSRHEALDLVADRLRVGVLGRLQRAHEVEWHAGRRARCVDRDVGGAPKRRYARRFDAP